MIEELLIIKNSDIKMPLKNYVNRTRCSLMYIDDLYFKRLIANLG